MKPEQIEELRALADSLGLPPLDCSKTLRVACPFCRVAQDYPVGLLTPEEAKAWETGDCFYSRGKICRPEAEAAAEVVRAAVERMEAQRFGEHTPECQRLLEAHRAEVDDIKTMRLSAAYLCRMPDCECDYPKTLAEWRTAVEGERLQGRRPPRLRLIIQRKSKPRRASARLFEPWVFKATDRCESSKVRACQKRGKPPCGGPHSH